VDIQKSLVTASLAVVCACALTVGSGGSGDPPLLLAAAAPSPAAAAGGYLPIGEYTPISVVADPSMADRDTTISLRVTIDRTNASFQGNVVVNLGSDDPQQFSSWQSQVTVPSGSSTAIATARTSHWGSGSLVTITASASGQSGTTKLQTLGSTVDAY
jgi:hypothetical protein